MKLTIDPVVIDKYDLTADAFLLLMIAVHNVDIQKARTELLQKGFILSTLDLGDGIDFKRTKLGVETYNNIILENIHEKEIITAIYSVFEYDEQETYIYDWKNIV